LENYQLLLIIGFGWGRESWSEGNWNSSLGFVLTGNGDIFSITTAGQLTTTANVVVVNASASFITIGEELTISQGEEIVTGTATIDITGEELIYISRSHIYRRRRIDYYSNWSRDRFRYSFRKYNSRNC
jgi:hypothetical protein